jgi:AcrR family transcriptional regulator
MSAPAEHMEAGSARTRILDTAAALFYEHGFHAVGIDLVIERAGVAKTTLYRHFPSKDDLIVAYLEDAEESFWAWFDNMLDPSTGPRGQLIGLFDAVAKLATDRACLGCAFQVTAAEFPELDHPGHATALAHKQAVRPVARAGCRCLRRRSADAGRRASVVDGRRVRGGPHVQAV